MKQSKIYSVFVNKLPNTYKSLLPVGKDLIVTFFNPYSVIINCDNVDLFNRFDYIASDGILPVTIIKIFTGNKYPRISFDMSSFAPVVFNYCIENRISIYFIGSSQENINAFKDVVVKEFSLLRIAGISNGYIDDEKLKIKEIINSGAGIVIVGMGSPRQDEFAVSLRDNGYKGSVYTCGGFFHQTTKKIQYYPNWVNRLHLRFLFRIYKEPYVLKRLLKYYPKFIFHFSIYCIRNIKRQ